ncbi:MAG: hypothetical protein Q9218_000960 [Villophora microphyllina]
MTRYAGGYMQDAADKRHDDPAIKDYDVAAVNDHEETDAAHTISQRLRTLKKIPPELIPLGIVLGVAIGAACYSLINKLITDKTLRLTRSNRSDNFK